MELFRAGIIELSGIDSNWSEIPSSPGKTLETWDNGIIPIPESVPKSFLILVLERVIINRFVWNEFRSE